MAAVALTGCGEAENNDSSTTDETTASTEAEMADGAKHRI